MAKNNYISTGSVDYGAAGNWSDGVPNAADDVCLENSNIDIGATLDQSAVALTSFLQWASYTGKVGLHNLSATPGTPGTYLQIDAATCILGRIPQPGVIYQGSPRMMIDLGAAQACACRVESTCKYASEQGLPPVRIKGVDAAHTLDVWRGHVGVACGRFDEVSTFATITVGQSGAPMMDARMMLGAGLTLGTKLITLSGFILSYCGWAAADLFGGLVQWEGAGAAAVTGVVTINEGATLVANATGTASGSFVVKKGGKLILSRSNATRNYGTITYDHPDCLDDNGAVTATRVPNFKGGGNGFGGA